MKAAAFVCASAVALAAALIGRDAAAAQDEQRTPPPSEAPQLAPTPATAASIDPTEAPDAARDRPPAPPPPDGAQALPPPPVAAPGEATGAATIADTVQAPQAKPGMGVSVGPIELKASGYFRAPLRLAFRSRGEGVKEGEGSYNIHTPWLVDDDYFRSGFQYTRIQESDWSELYFSAGNKYLTGDIAFMGSLFTDWARPILDRQWGIAQGYVTFRWQSLGPRLKFRMHVRAGSFWDRFGWLESYDTYVFGRTHQMGGQVRLEFELPSVTLWLVQGVGAHLDAIEANQGLTLLNYLHAGAEILRVARLGFYFLDSLANDKRQLKEVQDGSMRVVGLDLRLLPWVGSFYLAGSVVQANRAQYLSPVIEVMHSWGGRGLTENYLGTDKSDGTGSLYSLAGEYTFSLRTALTRVAPERLTWVKGGDLQLRWFGLVGYTLSKQIDPDPSVNRDGRLAFKWGSELFWQPFSFLFASLRYDRVIADVQDDASAFRILSPRLGFTTRWMVGAQIFLQYSRYFYGERVRLRPGQVALETLPDTDVVKLQAQIAF